MKTENQASPCLLDETIPIEGEKAFKGSVSTNILMGFGRSSVGFVAAKAAVLLLPLMLSKIWSLRDYGMFEYAVAWGGLLAVPLGVGTTGAVPYFLLQRRKPKYQGAFGLHSLLIGLSLLLTTAAYVMLGFNPTTYAVLLVTGILVVQGIRAMVYKVENAPVRASLMESGIYVVLLLFAASLASIGTRLNLRFFLIALNLYALLLVATSVQRSFWDGAWRNHIRRYRRAITFGVPIVFTSAAIIFLVSSSRLLAGKLFSLEAVGTYSFFLRISSPVVLVHNLLTTIYFRKLYQSGAKALDLYFSLILFGVFVLGILLFLVVPPLLGPHFPLLHDLHGSSLSIYFLLSIQMVFWIGIALAEAIIYRQNRANEFTRVLAGMIVMLLAATGVLKLSGLLTLLRLAQLQMGAMFLAFLAQIFILRRSGVPLIRTPAIAAVIIAVYLVCLPFFSS